MDKISVVLTVLMGLALSLLLAPNVLAMNRGKVLRNIALWLALFLGLTILYRALHPDTSALEQAVDQSISQSMTPASMKVLNDPFQAKDAGASPEASSSEAEEGADKDENGSSSRGFMPPSD